MTTHPSWSILLIEKSHDLQSLIQMSINLSIDGTIYIVHSVSEALEQIQNALPDVILIGLENNGLEALLELRAQPMVQAIPVIAITDRTRRSDQLTIQASGARAILHYPFEPIHLQSILQELGGAGRCYETWRIFTDWGLAWTLHIPLTFVVYVCKC